MSGRCIIEVGFSDDVSFFTGSATHISETSPAIRPSSATVSWQEMYKVASEVIERCLNDGGHAISGPSPALGSWTGDGHLLTLVGNVSVAVYKQNEHSFSADVDAAFWGSQWLKPPKFRVAV